MAALRTVLLVAAGGVCLTTLLVSAATISANGGVGIDASYYRSVGERFLTDGTYYRPGQLAGPYDVALMLDVLYPPTALLLFVPLDVLPIAVWWIIPLAVAALLTLPILPWGQFLDHGSAIATTALEQSHPNSALGIPFLMVLTAAALVSLGPYWALALVVPALFAQQPHFALFSLLAISRSTLVTLGAGWPTHGAAAVGVIAFAVLERVKAYRLGLRDTVDPDRARGDVARG